MNFTRRLLTTILEILDRDGWCQGALHNEAGQRCLMGALLVANIELGGSEDSFEEARDVLKQELPTGSLVSFNDEPGRTYEEVRAFVTSLAQKLQCPD